MLKVKICGITSLDDARLSVELGADILGFNFYPGSPRYLTIEQAAAIAVKLPAFVSLAGVFVNASMDVIRETARACHLDWIQLHGDETLEEIQSICSALKDTGIKVLKALRIDVDSGKALFPVTDPVKAAAILAESGISALVMDSKTGSRPAGTGVTLDWKVIQKVSSVIETHAQELPGTQAPKIHNPIPYELLRLHQ